MPVPGHRFEAEMVLAAEMSGEDAAGDYRQHDGANGDMETVEAGQHEESGAIDACLDGEGGFRVFMNLQAEEQDAQGNGEDQAEL